MKLFSYSKQKVTSIYQENDLSKILLVFFVYTADMDGVDYRNIDYADKRVLVIGAEGSGVSSIVRKVSDEIISIPMYGKINSLNASVSAAILIYGMLKE